MGFPTALPRPRSSTENQPVKQRKQSQCRQCGQPRRGHKRGSCPSSIPSVQISDSTDSQPQEDAPSTSPIDLQEEETEVEEVLASGRGKRQIGSRKKSNRQQTKRKKG